MEFLTFLAQHPEMVVEFEDGTFSTSPVIIITMSMRYPGITRTRYRHAISLEVLQAAPSVAVDTIIKDILENGLEKLLKEENNVGS